MQLCLIQDITGFIKNKKGGPATHVHKINTENVDYNTGYIRRKLYQLYISYNRR